MAQILVIDDDIEACETMVSLITRLSYNADKAHTLSTGLTKAQSTEYDLVFLDVFLPDGNGLDILPELMALPNPPEVIILTGQGNADGAELAIKGGVWDYLLKPTSVKDITLSLNRALTYRTEKKGHSTYSDEPLEGVVGKSPGIDASLKLANKAAKSDCNVLITGQTGTGKELFASIIHENSRRAPANFTVVDCTSLTESLVESTLFGHTKGSFTGAQLDKKGLIKVADGGTLFLDELGEMPLSIQKVFLRVLQEKQFRPVGSTKEQTSNFRLISATNRDLDQMAEEGKFRRDLLFRIKTMRIHLPPLQQRTGDIMELATFKCNQICNEIGQQPKEFSADFVDTLNSYSWPGNVRELFNILESSVIDAGNENILYAVHLPRSLRIEVAKKQISRFDGSGKTSTDNDAPTPFAQDISQQIFEDIFDRPLPQLKEFKGAAEKTYLTELIRQCDGNIQQIMQVSGLSRSHFYSLLKKYNLSQ